MANEGYNLTDPDDFDTIMDPYMQRLNETVSYPGDGITDEEIEAMTDEQRHEMWSAPIEYDQQLLAEAQAFEIAVAVTNWDCGMNDLYDAYQDAFAEVRREFIETNLGDIQALLDS